MDRQKLLIYIIFLMLFIFALDRIGSQFYWYYTLWWFDMLTHFLGGLWVGLFFIYVFSKKWMPLESHFKTVLNIMLWVLVVSLVWEIFEFGVNNIIGQTPFSISDTLSDLFFDLAGGFLAILFAQKIIMPTAESTVQLK